MRKTVFIAIVAMIMGLGITAAKATGGGGGTSVCDADHCPHSGVACCTDASGNTFYKGDQ